MDNISLLVLIKCLSFVIKQDGLIHSIKHKLVQFSISNGQQMEQFVLLLEEMEQ